MVVIENHIFFALTQNQHWQRHNSPVVHKSPPVGSFRQWDSPGNHGICLEYHQRVQQLRAEAKSNPTAQVCLATCCITPSLFYKGPPGHHHPWFCADPDLPVLLAYVGRRVVERDVQLCAQMEYYVRDAQLGLSELRYSVSFVERTDMHLIIFPSRSRSLLKR